jgi:hypothetical protein
MSQSNLLKKKKFLPFFITQFQGAFSDNFLKNALVILVTFKGLQIGNLSAPVMVAMIGACFIVPFFIFSAQSGILADKFEKTHLIKWIKGAEVLIMILAAGGLLAENSWILLSTVILMGTQAAFFGPVKFSILPQHLNEDEIVGGNALVEAGTFLAVLIGTILGGIMILVPQGTVWVSVILIFLSVLGYFACTHIPAAPPMNPNLKFVWNPWTPMFPVLKEARRVPSVFNSIMGISWFWFLGATFLTLFPTYVKESLGSGQGVVTLFLCLFSLGIALGSLLCERLSRFHLELGLVPFGSIGMSLFAGDLFFAGTLGPLDLTGTLRSIGEFLSTDTGLRICFDLLGFSIFSGFFIVPLNALIQMRSPVESRSQIIAANNIYNALFMVIAAIMLTVFAHQKVSTPALFLTLALMNIAVALYIYLLIPEFLLRFIVWMIANIFYRLKIDGRENIPKNGPAVLVCNHVSFVDWMIVAAGIKRPVRFVMDYHFFTGFLIKRIMRRAKVIPIASAKENPEILEAAFKAIAEELRSGEIICIFPEGKITKDGKMNVFRPGVERIIHETPVPVVPMALTNLWGSIFSREGGRALLKRPKRFWSRVGLRIGKALPPQEVTAEVLFGQVSQLLDGSSPASHITE